MGDRGYKNGDGEEFTSGADNHPLTCPDSIFEVPETALNFVMDDKMKISECGNF